MGVNKVPEALHDAGYQPEHHHLHNVKHNALQDVA